MIFNNTKKAFEKLKQEKSYKADSDIFLTSIYLNIQGKNRSDVETYIKSWLKQGFMSNESLKEKNNFRHDLFDEIVTELEKVESFSQGLVIFLKFTAEDDILEINIVQSRFEPKNAVYTDRIYNLDQLIWLKDQTANAIVLNIETQKCEVYKLKNLEFEFIEEFENNLLEESDKEYIETFKPRRTGESKQFHGTGEIDKQRQRKEFQKKFLLEVLDKLKEDIKERFDHLIIFHTEAFGDFEDLVLDEVDKDLFVKSHLISKYVEERGEVKSRVLKYIRDYNEGKKKELWEKSSAGKELYAEGWEEVFEEARLGKVKILFIESGIKQKGFLLNNELVYFEKQKEAIEKDNILPWLIKWVLDTDGEVKVFDELECEVASELRYA